MSVVSSRQSVDRLGEPSGINEGLLVRRMALRRRRRRAAFTGRVMSAVVIVLSAWAVLAATADAVLGR